MKTLSMPVLEKVLAETANPHVSYLAIFDDEVPMAQRHRNNPPSDDVQKLEDRLIDLHDQMNVINDNAKNQKRELTAKENAELETIFAEFETAEAELKRHKKSDAINARMSESRGRQTGPNSAAGSRPGQRRMSGGREQNIPEGAEVWIDQATNEAVPVFAHGQRISDTAPNRTGISCGSWLRSVLVGGTHGADVRNELATSPGVDGGYTVPAPLASEFIDALRAAMVLSRAGARTVVMPGKTLQLAKILADPAVAWHVENANINASQPTLGAVTLTAKTIVVTTKFSVELAQDSVNIDQILMRCITQALAHAIDSAGLVGDGSGNSPTGVLHFAGRNVVSGIGALASYDKYLDGIGALLNNNVNLDDVGPIIIGPHAWKDLAKIKTGISGDKTTLQKPPALTQPFLVTSAVETSSGSPLSYASTGFVGDWKDLLYGVRRDITVQILNQTYFGSNLTLAVTAYARVDFAGAREQSFATLEGITH